MSIISIHLRPARVHIAGRRIHHAWLGLAIIASDLRDWRYWIRDLRRH